MFSSAGFYVALFGASGPTLLWLTGRAQDHSLGWFLLTAAKIGTAMIGSILVVIALGLLMLGASIGSGFMPISAILLGTTLLLSVLWAIVTWAADRYIARVRVEDPDRA
jgi:protein-S-isoprenylcysteine O-methyltransferase Ste14